MRRREAWMSVLALAMALPSAFAQGGRLPQRNLLVELRWIETRDSSAQDASARGGFSVGTAGQVDAQGSVVLRSARGDGRAQAAQQVLVLNGHRAGVRMGEAVPLQWLELASTPKGPVGVLRQAWVDSGSGFEVKPQWPGGAAPVMVEVSRSSTGVSAASAPQGEEMSTTLELPMNEWVTVAHSGESALRPAEGTVSSRDAERRTRRLLQMRISAP